MINNYIKLIRLNNWIKNTFIFLPLFFSSEFLNEYKLLNTLIVAAGFSIVTGFIYIINDIFDIKFDKNHPKKKHRPIASGTISVKKSFIIASVLLIVGLVIIGQISTSSLVITIIYVILNLGYSFKLKQVPIVDLIIVSIGFVIRILIGAEVSDVPLTQWMIIMVFLLSLFIAISKRRDDVCQFEKEQKINRKVVTRYTVEFMDKSITIISSVLIVSYLLFITSNDVMERYQSDFLLITFIPVLIGVLRYNQITYVYNKSDSPIKTLLSDTFLQLILFSWVLIFCFIIYSNQIF